MRPGRIDRKIFVPPPNFTARAQILKLNLSKMPCSPDVNIEELAAKTEGYSGAELTLLCREAALVAMQQNINIEQVLGQTFQFSQYKYNHSLSHLLVKRTAFCACITKTYN
jgi:transitional endoplasmic reticulum ATPase